jgi:glycosyltransferase involved in cell wall biosynthesis
MSTLKPGPDHAEAMVSVIIPLFNGQSYIEETIHCVLEQTHARLEVIVVDDGSTDGGVEVVRRLLGDPRVSLIMKPHAGIAATRNAGLAWSDPASEYVLFLDQDDVIAADLLEALVAILSRRRDAVGAHAIADFIDDAGRPLHVGGYASAMRSRRGLEGRSLVVRSPEADVRWPELFFANHLYPPSAILLRKADVLDSGGFDPSYDVADDWDLLVRLLRRGPLVPWDEVRVGYRRHDANASSHTERNVRETRAVWANTYYSCANARGDRALLRRFWRAHQRAASSRKRREAATMLRRREVGAAFTRAADAVGHLLLVRPLRGWRTTRRARTDLDRLGVREVGR